MKSRFTDHGFDIEVTCGLDSSPMRVHATEFVPACDSESSLSVVKNGRDGRLNFSREYVAPIALQKAEMRTLQWRCLSYVKSMAKKQKETTVIELRPMHPISRQLLRLILKYHETQPTARSVGSSLFPLFQSDKSTNFLSRKRSLRRHLTSIACTISLQLALHTQNLVPID